VRDTIFSRVRIAAVAGCIAAGALAVVGCGGGGDSTSSTGASGASGASGSEPLSKDEFVSQANAICADVNDKIEALQQPPQNPQVSELVPVFTQELAITREGETKLEALTPPSELQDERDKLVANTRKAEALVDKIIAAAKANDASQAQSLAQQLDALNKQDNQIAESIGLTECAKDVSPQG
jgi:hypothetical protein